MGVLEILLIAACVAIVIGVSVAAAIRKKKGKCSCGCSDCPGGCCCQSKQNKR